nr:hypothetical protein PU94_03755 [Coprobacter secundus]
MVGIGGGVIFFFLFSFFVGGIEDISFCGKKISSQLISLLGILFSLSGDSFIIFFDYLFLFVH